ncbi:MAG: carbohydrate kinase, partial [Anaerolineae bacterium]|nr:carbohydrate kinase [Anaerolineae bacterium]
FQYAHLAKIAEEEWAVATGHTDLDAGIQAVLDRGVELLILSRGADGALATNGDFRIEIPALLNINVVETTGAGDGFMGAMITRLLPEFERRGSLRAVDEATVREALHYANHVGALTCTRPGAIPALPYTDEVAAFIASRGGITAR